MIVVGGIGSVYLCCILLVVHHVLRAHRVAGGTPVKMELGCRVIVREARYVHLRWQGYLHCGPGDMKSHKRAKQGFI